MANPALFGDCGTAEREEQIRAKQRGENRRDTYAGREIEVSKQEGETMNSVQYGKSRGFAINRIGFLPPGLNSFYCEMCFSRLNKALSDVYYARIEGQSLYRSLIEKPGGVCDDCWIEYLMKIATLREAKLI